MGYILDPSYKSQVDNARLKFGRPQASIGEYRIWPNLPQIRLRLTELVKNAAKPGRDRHRSAKFRPRLADFGPELAVRSQFRTEAIDTSGLGENLANFAPIEVGQAVSIGPRWHRVDQLLKADPTGFGLMFVISARCSPNVVPNLDHVTMSIELDTTSANLGRSSTSCCFGHRSHPSGAMGGTQAALDGREAIPEARGVMRSGHQCYHINRRAMQRYAARWPQAPQLPCIPNLPTATSRPCGPCNGARAF